MMHPNRPRSVLGLVLIGFSLVALPLLIAVIHAVFYVDKLAEHSQRLVLRGVRVTRINERLSEHITDMERYARQYFVVGDAALWDLYLEKKATIAQTLVILQALDHEMLMTPQITALIRLSEVLDESLPARPASDDGSHRDAPADMVERFTQLRVLATTIAQNSNAFLDSELEALDVEATLARRRLLWQSAALVPITIALGAVFTVLIAHPIRKLGTAITNLGEYGFSDPIAITGPPELRALGARLDWLRTRLREADETKSTFIRHISHELKTPLASLREGTELLVDGSVGVLSPTQKEVAEILQDNCLKLQTLIENMLDFSAWQEDAFRLNLTHFDLRAVVDSVVEQHCLAIRAKALRVDIEAIPIELDADREKLHTAVDNLIANAIKFSPRSGRVSVAMKTDGVQAHLDIYDNGPGISTEDRDRVFEPFYQGAHTTGSHVRGTGIGLSVVRECARAHRGDIILIEDDDRGGHFRLSIPLNPPEDLSRAE